jgi:hypothetical protein
MTETEKFLQNNGICMSNYKISHPLFIVTVMITSNFTRTPGVHHEASQFNELSVIAHI